ncbi:hypothetical protein Q3G72_003903 [Acer saccharum]|nr:hypothetical protein Q3G72_003903 [Acer saccharum]
MIEVVLNDRLGKKVRVKCNDDDTIGDLKKTMRFTMAWDSNSITINSTFLYLYQFADIQIKLHGDECPVCSSNNALFV